MNELKEFGLGGGLRSPSASLLVRLLKQRLSK